MRDDGRNNCRMQNAECGMKQMQKKILDKMKQI
jgi:hypothetical protein